MKQLEQFKTRKELIDYLDYLSYERIPVYYSHGYNSIKEYNGSKVCGIYSRDETKFIYKIILGIELDLTDDGDDYFDYSIVYLYKDTLWDTDYHISRMINVQGYPAIEDRSLSYNKTRSKNTKDGFRDYAYEVFPLTQEEIDEKNKKIASKRKYGDKVEFGKYKGKTFNRLREKLSKLN